ncbi:MAG: DUF1631 family protein [Lysobacteraceae bacterium]
MTTDPRIGGRPPQRAPDGSALPRRVRTILTGISHYTGEEIQRWLTTTLDEFEAALELQSNGARSFDQQVEAREALAELQVARPRLLPALLATLESALFGLRNAPAEQPAAPLSIKASALSLVNEVEIEEDIVLKEAANRAEMRCGMPLFLLGQRFGVLAARPAFDADSLPIGPHALCRMLRESTLAGSRFDQPRRIQLFRLFERQVTMLAASFYEAINQQLIDQGVLPNMSYVPVRLRRSAQGQADKMPPEPPPVEAAPKAGNDAPAKTRFQSAERALGTSGGRAASALGLDVASASALGAAISADADAYNVQDDAEFFSTLRKLMASKRSLLGKLGSSPPGAAHRAPPQLADAGSVQDALGRLQESAPTMVRAGDRSVVRSVAHLKQDLLAELRRQAPNGQALALPEEDTDAIDLVGMLFEQLVRDVRPNSLGSSMLARLQVPLLRVALKDRSFFSQSDHPARQMLNAVAEATAHWSSDDDVDRELAGKMGMVVDRVNKEFDGDVDLLERLAGDIGQQVQAQARRAEIAERRHVEAARGKEKLETARIHAAQALDARLADKPVPKFLNSLLEQTWGDVLALSALRGGEDSAAYRHQLEIADKVIDVAVAQRSGAAAPVAPAQAQALREEIEQALGQVGYHEEDARTVATRLLSGNEEDKDDPASRTELAIKLKQHARFGQQREQNAPPGVSAVKVDELSAEERLQLEALKRLPFGVWLEMTPPDRGERVRRRMSWYSPVTGNCLIVNHRGQRVGEFPLTWLAREMVAGRAALVNENAGSLVDRAWKAILSTLKVFGGPAEATA